MVGGPVAACAQDGGRRPDHRVHHLAFDPLLDGLGFLPYSNGVHDDFAGQPRRQVYRAMVADGTLPPGYASEDGLGLHYVGTRLRAAMTVQPGAVAWWVDRNGHRRIPARMLEADKSVLIQAGFAHCLEHDQRQKRTLGAGQARAVGRGGQAV
jgi:hypothetical protein